MSVPQPFANRVATRPEAFSAQVLDGFDDPFFAKAGEASRNVFQSEAFLGAFRNHVVSCPVALTLVGVSDSLGNPVAAFPFVRRRKFGVWTLEATDFGIVDYFAPAFFRETELGPEDTARLWDAVCKAVPGIHAITFTKLPQRLYGKSHALSGAPFLKRMGAFATTLTLRDKAGTTLVRPDKMSIAREVRRKAKKLEKYGPVSFVEANSCAEIESCMETLVAFRRARFAELGRHDAMLDPRIVAFYRALANPKAGEPIGRLFSVRAGDETVSVVYGFSWRGVFTLIAPTISPKKDVQAGSPGLMILFKTLQWCSERGFDVLDLSVGSMHYKTRFNADTIPLFEYQQALSPLGLPVVAEAALRRWVRRLGVRTPWVRTIAERALSLWHRPGKGASNA